MFTHEDCYFNGVILVYFEDTDRKNDILFVPQITYKWVLKIDSTTRKRYNGHDYIETYLKDYIAARVNPILMSLDRYPNKKEINKQRILSILLYCYFYFQSFCYCLGEENIIIDNVQYIKDIIIIQNYFDMSLDNIIDYIYSDPILYHTIRDQARTATGMIVELTSFKDFIYRINNS